MTPDILMLVYVVGLLALLAVAAGYSEFRRRHFRAAPNQDRIFRCGKCGFVYTDDPDVDRSRCAQCGALNEAIKF